MVDYSEHVGGVSDVFEFGRTPRYAHAAEIHTMKIDSGITTVGSGAFFECGNLTSVTIPNSVTRIGEAAFSYCGNLTDIYY